MSEIELRRVSKCYSGHVSALEALDLNVASGELLVVLGPSGSGKTTLLRLIAGLESPTSGALSIKGRDMTRVPAHRRDVAMVFQHPALYPHLSVFDNLAFSLRARGMTRNQTKSKVNTMAGLLGLDELLGRSPGSLSGGEKQRVAIGRALARQPSVLLFDEPFSSLDPPLHAALREEVVDLHRRFGTTLILVTHDQADALLMGDRIAILDRGRLLQCGTPKAVYHLPHHRFVATFVGSPPMNILPCDVIREGEEIRIRLVAADQSLSWTLPTETRAAEWPQGIDQVELGLRPESISLREIEAPTEVPTGSPSLLAQVRRLEFNGADLLATVALGPHRLVARVPTHPSLHERQRIQAVLNLENAVWFDPATGRSLGRI